MNMLKSFWGRIIYGLAKFLSLVFDIVIGITGGIVLFVQTIGRGLVGLISMGGCLILFILGPICHCNAI